MGGAISRAVFSSGVEVSLSPYEQGRYRDLSQFRTKVGFRVHLVKVEHDLQRTPVHEHAHPPVSARCAKFEPTDPNDAANTCRGRIPDKGEVGGSSPLRSTINPQCLCGHSRFCLSPNFLQSLLSTICQLPESLYAAPDVTGDTITWRWDSRTA
jgi:hypothetical protein